MGIEYESVVEHPIAEVFAWHTRPGAMTAAGAAVAADEGGGRDASRWPTGGPCSACPADCDGSRSTIQRGSIRRTDSSTYCRRRARCPGRHGSSAGGGTRMSSARRPVAHGSMTTSTPRCPLRRCARRSSIGTGSSPRIWPHTAPPPTPARADGRRGHRRLGSGRLRVVGVPEHGRASRDPARAPTGAQRA